jgi:uncharacterized membrane protein
MTSSNIIVFGLVFILGLALGGAVIYLLGRRKATSKVPDAAAHAAPGLDLSFSFSYIALSVIIAAITIIALAVLYPSLPAQVDYRFSSSGVPRSSISREGFLAVMVMSQLLMVAAAAAIAGLVLRVARRMLADAPPPSDPTQTIWLMVNMVVLPQVIVSFVALDAVYYAHFGSHSMTPWLFSLIALGIGTLTIIVLFTRSFNETRKVK